MGTGADRQLRVWNETGDLKKVVDYIIEETEVGLHDSGRQVATVTRVLRDVAFGPGTGPKARATR
jgi:hypothetical protein